MVEEHFYKKRPDLLASLIHVGNVFNTQRDFDQLLAAILTETVKILEADRGSLFLLDEETDEVWSRIAIGLNKGEVIRLKKNEGIVGSVISTGKALNIPDAYADSRFNREIDQHTGYDTTTILCYPLTTFEGKTIGAFQVLNKKKGPFTREDEQILNVLASQACVAIENVQDHQKSVQRHKTLSRQNIHLKTQLVGKYAYPTIVGDSPGMMAVTSAIDKVSTTNANVLVTGESGTGKELIARGIHSKSLRANMPFIALNCASLPETLLESELFGIEKGIATGVGKRTGFFEMANSGTLFLDEIGEMSLSMQAKLLRALQEHSFLRVGGSEEIEVDVRVIAATNQELQKSIQEGTFREDLYYRLNVFPIHIPALRDRRNDIPMLANFILANVAEKMNLGEKTFTPGSFDAMVLFSWPGNVRELENMIERAVILGEGAEVNMEPFFEGMTGSAGSTVTGLAAEEVHRAEAAPGGRPWFDPDKLEMKQAVAALETAMIAEALRQTRGNQLKAAKVLGISREGLRRKMKRFVMNSEECAG